MPTQHVGQVADLGSLGPGDQSLADISDGEAAGCLNIVPVLL